MTKKSIKCEVCEAEYTIIAHNSEAEERVMSCPYCNSPIEEIEEPIEDSADDEYDNYSEDIRGYSTKKNDSYWLDDDY